MNITIVGGGNIGTQFAALFAEKGHEVVVYTSKPERFSKKLYIVDQEGNITNEGEIQCATADADMAFQKAEIIFVTFPAFSMKEIAKNILPYAKKGLKIALIPGTGGGECAFKECLEKGCIIMGLQRVPSVARVVDYGKKVCAVGYRKELHLATLPSQSVQECCSLMETLFSMPCNMIKDYLNITLTPSNPILHTSRLRAIFENYEDGVTYEKIPLFYEEWNDYSSEILLKNDSEVQKICQNLQNFELSNVKSLKEHYESDTIQKMTKKISSIDSLKGLKTPMLQVGEKYIPDLNSRYFTADFPFGLAILKQIAELVHVEVPGINQTWEWYCRVTGNRNCFKYQDYGICDYESFEKFYKQ